MGDRLEIHRRRYSEGVVLALLGLAMVVGLILLVRVPAREFGGIFIPADEPAGQGVLVGGLLKALLAMALAGLALLIYWNVRRMLTAVPEMVIDARGILVRLGEREQLLAWDDVVRLRIDTARGVRSLRVSPAPDLVLGASVGRLFGWMDIIITRGAVNVDFNDLIAFVKRVAPRHLTAQL